MRGCGVPRCGAWPLSFWRAVRADESLGGRKGRQASCPSEMPMVRGLCEALNLTAMNLTITKPLIPVGKIYYCSKRFMIQ